MSTMTKMFFIFLFDLLLFSCRFKYSSDRNLDPSRTYKLKLNPPPGSKYYYDISNESELKMEVSEEKKVAITNTSALGFFYDIAKDTAGNFILRMKFDKIHITSDNGETKTELDADNALSLNPMEKMLAILKSANIAATLSASGETKQITGYKEVGEQLVAATNSTDENAKAAILSQWDKVVGNGMIKNNISQFFKMFPDSALHIGDKWNLKSSQNTDLNLKITSHFKLKDINDYIAEIESEGEMESDNTPTTLMGYQVIANVKGTQKGRYEMETQTGMLLNSTVISNLEGTMEMMGRQVPIKMEITVSVQGRKIK
jgi:hypothetical protein